MLACALSACLAVAGSDLDIKAGEQLYGQCLGCHAPDYNRTGPKHCGIIGRKSGTVKNFNYTDAMKNSAITWNKATLNQFLTAPLKMIPKTSMGISGISSKLERSQLIAYMSQLNSNNPLCK